MASVHPPGILLVTHVTYWSAHRWTFLVHETFAGWVILAKCMIFNLCLLILCNLSYLFISYYFILLNCLSFTQSANASMPFIMGDYLELWKFARKQQERFDYSERVWVQQLERVDQCTMFTYQTIEIDHCAQPSLFICEIGMQNIITIQLIF